MSNLGVSTKEVRVVDPVTGGEKGAKPWRLGLLPFSSLWEVSLVYNYGASKYAEHNWRKGYKWSLSFDALLRHLTAWWEGEEKDPESGLSHLAHATFHILTLIWFQLNAKGTDDRYKRPCSNEVPARPEVSLPGEGRLYEAVDGTLRLVDEEERPKEMDCLCHARNHPHHRGRMECSL